MQGVRKIQMRGLSMNEKLDKQTYRKVEAILYEYKTYESAIKNLEAEIEELEPFSRVDEAGAIKQHPAAPGDTSTTEGTVIYRLESKKALKLNAALKKKKARKEAVEACLRELSERQVKIFDLKYNRDYTHEHIAQMLGLFKSQYYIVKDKTIAEFSKYLGFI